MSGVAIGVSLKLADTISGMARCTAPVRGHNSAQARADCPACGGGYGGYRDYGSYSYQAPYRPVAPSQARSSNSGGGSSRTARPRWSASDSSVTYTPKQVRDLEPVRKQFELRVQEFDVFLCHAWNDRKADAKMLYDLLVEQGVSVWFSEVSLRLGTDMRAAIDKGLRTSRIGLVLVTPAMLERLLEDKSVAGSELSALLRRDLLVPVLHEATFEQLDNVSPLLATKGGLDTAEESMRDVAMKIAELVTELAEERVDER